MIYLFITLLTCVAGTNHDVLRPDSYQNIPITVQNIWQIPYATDIQDISLRDQYLVIRSNADRKLYLADKYDCSLLEEIQVPAFADGFGVAVSSSGPCEYYINSWDVPEILCYDSSDTWSSFSNPAGTSGSGMNLNFTGGPELYEASAQSPYQFYGIESAGSYCIYPLSGITGEISGFMPHGLTTDQVEPPSAAIVATRLGHEFFFYMQSSGSMNLYAQEPCPITVLQSLGLVWDPMDFSVYWSYQGLDSLYYVARLEISIFGDIEDEATGISGISSVLNITSNPAQGSANFTVNLNEPAFAVLDVYDVSGRLVETLQSGELSSGLSTFSFDAPPGLYISVLRSSEQVQHLRFVISE